MAPANGGTGTSGQGPGVSRVRAGAPRIVPAIPLSYLQPRRRNEPPTAVNAHAPALEQTNRRELGRKPSSPTKPPAITNGVDPEPDETGETTIEPQQPSHSPIQTPPIQEQVKISEPRAVTPPTTAAETVTAVKELGTPVAQTPIAPAQPNIASPTPTRHRAGIAFDSLNGPQHQHQHQPSALNTVRDVYRDAAANHEGALSIDPGRIHPQPGNDGLVFGGLHDSSTASPAPLSGGAQAASSVSYTSEGTAAMGIDAYGRPFHVSPGFEGFPPDAFPPPGLRHPLQQQQGLHTPHSFHGSQPSTQADENGFAAYPPTNGHHTMPPHSAGHPPPHMATMSLEHPSGLHSLHGPHSSGPVAPCIVSRSQAQILDFLRDGFERGNLSDCVLELRLPSSAQKSRDGPVVIPCHRFIISQSPMLSQILYSQDIQAGGRLVLDVQDPYMRADSFSFALRTLYGWDLGDGPLPPYHPQQPVQHGFDLALGYAAAGSYLNLPFVYAKGIHHACHQLHWETIEKACQFAISRTYMGQYNRDAISHPDVFTPFALVDAIKAFLIHNIPADFVLDVNAGDCGFNRLPASSVAQNAPAVAHGTSPSRPESQHGRHDSQTHMPRGHRLSTNPRLSFIQFGDLALANGNDNGIAAAARSHSPSHVDIVLSRILLNLPFPMLKQVLEHPNLARQPGDLNHASRLKLISSIVAEREARRLAVLSNGDEQLRVYVNKLEGASQPLAVQEVGDFLVNNMGFKEEVFPGDAPYLVQTWINSHGSASAQ